MTANNIAISINNISKVYKLYDRPIDRLKEVLNPFRKPFHREFQALNNINLTIKSGHTIGILGKNGSGKSTLLKIITGVLTPTSGNVEINGKIAALLELGTGFNPELTGIENIYLNGSLMGFSRDDMSTKIEKILKFADIGDFIYQPVKLYSSGMFARLAFSVAINVDPDILIVDEALSVGDIFFQAKCYEYFENLHRSGKTVIFVTHSLDIISRICTYAYCLKNGTITFEGMPADVVDHFKKQNSGEVGKTHINEPQKSLLSSHYELNPQMDSYGNLDAEITDFGILDTDGKVRNSFFQGEEVNIVLKIRKNKNINSLIGAFNIRTIDGIDAVGTNTALGKYDLSDIIEKSSGTISFRFPLFLKSGEYLLSLGLTYFSTDGELKVYHRLYNIVNLTIHETYPGTGIFTPKIEIHLTAGNNV